jgi:Ulp1 family protease
MNDAYHSYCGVTSTFEWNAYKYLLVPVNMNSHWSLAVIEDPFQEAQGTVFYHIDSVYGYHNPQIVVEVLIKYIANEKKKKKGLQHTMNYRSLHVGTEPQQGNGYDCGLYVLHYMEKIVNYTRNDRCISIYEVVQSICVGFTPVLCNEFRGSIRSLLHENRNH